MIALFLPKGVNSNKNAIRQFNFTPNAFFNRKSIYCILKRYCVFFTVLKQDCRTNFNSGTKSKTWTQVRVSKDVDQTKN